MCLYNLVYVYTIDSSLLCVLEYLTEKETSGRFFKKISKFNFIFYLFSHGTASRDQHFEVILTMASEYSSKRKEFTIFFVRKSVPLFSKRILNKTGK